MVRLGQWFAVGLIVIAMTGCGGGDAQPAANNANGNAAPPAAGAAPPGMAGPAPAGMPGMPGMPGAPGAGMQPAAAAAPPVATPPRDPLVFLPANVTFAVGGRPSAILKTPNRVATAFLKQFSPLTSVLARAGLPATDFESFWAAGTADLTEQALCVVTKVDINADVIKLQAASTNTPAESKVWPLKTSPDGSFVIAVMDPRTILIGRKGTVESSIRKTPSTLIKHGLWAANQPDADFWMAGDQLAAKTLLADGLPVMGPMSDQLANLSTFGVGITLEGKPQVPGTAEGAMNGMGAGTTPMGPGMTPMGAGMTPMGPGAGTMTTPMTTPMPMGAAGGHAAPAPAGATPMPTPMGTPTPMGMATPAPAGGHAAPASATPQPAGATPTSAAPMTGAMPGAYPANSASGTTSPTVGAGEQRGIRILAGLVFSSEATATEQKKNLDNYLTSGARRRSPKTGQYVPDLTGKGAANQQPGMMNMGGPGAMPMPAGAGAFAGSPQPNSSGSSPSVAVILEQPSANNNSVPNLNLQPASSSFPTVPFSNEPTANVPSAGSAPMPGTTPMGPMPGVGPGPMAGAVTPMPMTPMPMTTMSPMPVMTTAEGPGAMMGAPGQTNSVQWTNQQGTLVQFAYRFDAQDDTVALAGYLMRGLGLSEFGDPMTASPLTALHKAIEQWRPISGQFAQTNGSYGPGGTGWMVHLLPYLDHQDLYKQFDFKKPVTDPANSILAHTVIPEFLNPGDTRQQWVGPPYNDWGLTHFVGMSGVEDPAGPPAATLPRNDDRAGIFGYNEIATPEMITDGTSQTIMMIGNGVNSSPWAAGGGATIRGARPNSLKSAAGFGSSGHKDMGAYVLFADGSVRFVSSKTDDKVFRAMSTTHGKDTVDLEALTGSGVLFSKGTP